MQTPPSPPARSRWRHPALIVALLVFFPPVGIWLAWRSGWARPQKVVAMGLSAVWLLLLVVSDPPEEDAGTDAETVAADVEETEEEELVTVPDYAGQNLAAAVEAARADGYATVSHDATDEDVSQWREENWTVCFQTPGAGSAVAPGTEIDFAVVREDTPCPPADGLPVVHPKVPSVLELPHDEAVELLASYGLTDVAVSSAYRDVELPDGYGDWIVCFQRPGAGEVITEPEELEARLSLTGPGVDCPAFENDRLNPPEPAPEPAPDPDPVPAPEPAPGSASGGSGDDGGSWAHYENCDAVRAAGRAPLYVGEPGYRKGLDRDGDGIACET
ncbi:excalibur calcium-binding domain-containing protein [Streptomyces carpaticus]|uniref:excalibur calcium-binding domain-containing protein n=1 Tax=Streptomyces carpaticus TaxID=285558 RepID=UPI0022076BFE|nr:excalibur calcium-binding domain-containing protein [Streptomyces carpaticus]